MYAILIAKRIIVVHDRISMLLSSIKVHSQVIQGLVQMLQRHLSIQTRLGLAVELLS